MLPHPDEIRQKLQSLAMLDAIVMPDWELRYFSFNSQWSPGEMMGSLRDGEGSEFFFLFNETGVAAKIYCKDYSLEADTAAAMLGGIPLDFSSFLNEAAFNLDVATCYLWRRKEDHSWSVAPRDIVEIPFLAFVYDWGNYYLNWSASYYELGLNVNSIEAILRHQPLTENLIKSLNPDAELEAIVADANQIGYPK